MASLMLKEFEAIAGTIVSASTLAAKELSEIVRQIELLASKMNCLLPDEGEELVALPLEPAAREAWVRMELARLSQDEELCVLLMRPTTEPARVVKQAQAAMAYLDSEEGDGHAGGSRQAAVPRSGD